MSAFIVSHDHIDALMSYAARRRVSFFNGQERIIIGEHNAEEIGRILLDENVRSVASRYTSITDDEKDVANLYRFHPWPLTRPLSAVQVIKAVACLDYQCCETEDWEASLAYRICQAITSHAVSALPGYDDAEWELVREAA